MHTPARMSRTVTTDRLPMTARVGDYRIERELREEDTGIVYLAHHVVLPRAAAYQRAVTGGEAR